MKRHESLAPLSREHHEALILAQLLKKNAPSYRGLPADMPGKVSYAKKIFEDTLKQHFSDEESILRMAKGISPQVDTMSADIINEHSVLTSMFGALGAATVESLDELGHFLGRHIRKEERELFPLLEKHCDDAMLEKIKSVLVH